MSDIWDPLGEAKGCLNRAADYFVFLIIGTILGAGVLSLFSVPSIKTYIGEDSLLPFLFALAAVTVPVIFVRIWQKQRWYLVCVEALLVLLGAFILFDAIPITPSGQIQRSRAKRTMADMRSIAHQMDAFREKQGVYPAFNDLVNFGKFFQIAAPVNDGWKHPLVFKATDKEYWLVSCGRDGKPDVPEVTSYKEGSTTSFDNDLVLHNGKFIQYPEGTLPGGSK